MKGETNCTDNFSLPAGPQGERGDKGDKGNTGPKGATGPQGEQGQPGSGKIDIHFREDNNPYVTVTTLTSSGEKLIGYFIFSGTTDYTPSYIKVAVSAYTGIGTPVSTLKLYLINSDGSKVLISTLTSSQSVNSDFVYKIMSSSSLSNLPSTESIFALYGSIDVVGENENALRVHALEMK